MFFKKTVHSRGNAARAELQEWKHGQTLNNFQFAYVKWCNHNLYSPLADSNAKRKWIQPLQREEGVRFFPQDGSSCVNSRHLTWEDSILATVNPKSESNFLFMLERACLEATQQAFTVWYFQCVHEGLEVTSSLVVRRTVMHIYLLIN